MLSTQYLVENYNFQTFTFAIARLVYRAGWGIANNCERIQAALIWLYAASCFVLPGLLVLAKALTLVAIPTLAMVAILTVPGLPLCLVAFAVFAFVTWPQAVRNGR